MLDEKWQHLQKILEETGQGLQALDRETQLDQLEAAYQERVAGFSPAYLAGSKWYVGPSLRAHLEKQPLETRVIGLLGALTLVKQANYSTQRLK